MKAILSAATLAAIACVGISAPAHAGLVGSSVSYGYFYPTETTPYPDAIEAPDTFIVGFGPESVTSVEGVTLITVDFTNNGLNLLFNTTLPSPTWTGAPFNGLIFTSSAFSQFSGVTINPASTFGPAGVTYGFADDKLYIGWPGVSYADGQIVAFSFSSDVPEPATWAMFIVGFGAIGMAARRRKMVMLN